MQEVLGKRGSLSSSFRQRKPNPRACLKEVKDARVSTATAVTDRSHLSPFRQHSVSSARMRAVRDQTSRPERRMCRAKPVLAHYRHNHHCFRRVRPNCTGSNTKHSFPTEGLRISRFNMQSTALRWTPKLIVSTPRSNRKTESLSPVWSYRRR